MMEPTCPATLAPMACISTKFVGSSCLAMRWMTRADIGNAEMPAAPDPGASFVMPQMG